MATTAHPGRVNFRLYPGATFTEVTSLLNAAGDPVDLTGYTAQMHIKRDPGDTVPVFALSTANGGITLDPQGQITLTLSATASTPLLDPPIDQDGETWYHDLLLINPAFTPPRVDRLYQGMITVLPGITPYPVP